MTNLKNKRMNLQLFGAKTPVDPTKTNTHISESFGKLLEPGLRKIFFEYLKELPEQYSKVFNMNTSKKAAEHDYGLGAFGDWKEREDNLDTVDYQTLSPGLERTYRHKAFTQGFMIERELYDDEQYRQINKFPRSMARSGRQKVEKDAAKFLIDSFTENIYDGKPLFAKDHPLLDSDKTCSNLMEGPLTEENLKKAIKLMKEQLDEAGNLVQMKPNKLIIPPALEDTAKRLLNSTLLPGTELNDTNKYLLESGIQIVILDYLSEAGVGSDTVWFLQDSEQHELNFFWRIRPEFKWDEDFDTFVAKYRGYMRYSLGASDWRGMVGSKGTSAVGE